MSIYVECIVNGVPEDKLEKNLIATHQGLKVMSDYYDDKVIEVQIGNNIVRVVASDLEVAIINATRVH